MLNKGFLTNEELKLGNQSNIQSIDRSISKLHELSYKNWNILDLKKSLYSSPSNFAKVYSKDPKERLKQALALNSVLDNVLKSEKKSGKHIHFDPKELRNQQIADISEMIKEKRMSTNGTVLLSPKSPSISSAAGMFNRNRNDSKSLVDAINAE